MFRSPRSRSVAAGSAVVVASFFRPIEFWTRNVWDLSSIVGLLGVGALISLVGLTGLWCLRRIGVDLLVAAIGIGLLLIILVRWISFPDQTGLLALVAVAIATYLGNHRLRNAAAGWVCVAFLAAFGLVPIVQLVAATVTDADPYPIVNLRSPRQATATEEVEDVVVLIVDTYPNPYVAESWFGHDPNRLGEILEERGFEVAPNAWSRHTYTALSVASILELTSVIEPGSTAPWGNRSSLWAILRGDNFASETLASAGYAYTHYETGWDGSSCGSQVDTCIGGPLLDESMRTLLLPTILHEWVAPRHFIATGTIGATSALDADLPDITSNGTHDYVFAHLLLPHPPLLVDQLCRRVDVPASDPLSNEYRTAFRRQLQCVDDLLVSITGHVDEDTAVLLTGDHGPDTQGQLSKSPGEWTDSDIAERFGVLLAYKVPMGCPATALSDPMLVMASILDCALVESFSAPEPEYLIGAIDPVAVDPKRMDDIKALVGEDASSNSRGLSLSGGE